MVVQLLALGRARAEQGASGIDQILAPIIQGLINEEVFLLGADGGLDGGDVRVAEEPEHAQRLLVDGLH